MSKLESSVSGQAHTCLNFVTPCYVVSPLTVFHGGEHV